MGGREALGLGPAVGAAGHDVGETWSLSQGRAWPAALEKTAKLCLVLDALGPFTLCDFFLCWLI